MRRCPVSAIQGIVHTVAWGNIMRDTKPLYGTVSGAWIPDDSYNPLQEIETSRQNIYSRTGICPNVMRCYGSVLNNLIKSDRYLPNEIYEMRWPEGQPPTIRLLEE